MDGQTQTTLTVCYCASCLSLDSTASPNQIPNTRSLPPQQIFSPQRQVEPAQNNTDKPGQESQGMNNRNTPGFY